MQDQLQFTIGYIWVKLLTMQVETLIFFYLLKCTVKRSLKKMEAQSATHLSSSLKSRNTCRTKINKWINQSINQFKHRNWVQQLIPKTLQSPLRLFQYIDMYSWTLCLNIHCPCSPMAVLRLYSKTASTVMPNTYMPIKLISTLHHSAKIFTDI